MIFKKLNFIINKNILKICFMLFLTDFVKGFDFDRALRAGKFLPLPNHPSKPIELDPSAMDNEASLAFYKLRGEKLENSNQEFYPFSQHEPDNISIVFHTSSANSSLFQPGLTFNIIQFHHDLVSPVDFSSKIDVYIQFDDQPFEIVKSFTDIIDLPFEGENNFDDVTISTTDYSNSDTEKQVALKIDFLNLKHLEDVYFMVTAYGLVTETNACSIISYHMPGIKWWECGNEDDDLLMKNSKSTKHCISFDLTCDGLPNCGEPQIPNSDEVCYPIDDLHYAVQILLYVVCILIIVIVGFSLAKCIMLRFCGRSDYTMTSRLLRELMEQQQAELAAAGPPERPVNAPPTYDDAMKQVNLAFQYDSSDDEISPGGRDETDNEELEPPPAYTQHDNEVTEESATIDRSNVSQTQDVCDCSRPSTSRGFNNNGYVNNNDSNINNNNENQRNLNTNNNESQTDSMAVPSVQSRWRFTYPLATRHFPLINQSIIRSSGSGSQSENAQRQSSQSQASTSSSNQSEVTINQSMPYDPPPYSP